MQENQKTKNPFHNYVIFSGIAIQMGVTISIFTYIGIWIDKKISNEYSIFTVTFSLLGVIGSLYLIIKQVIKYSKEKNDA